MLKFGFKMKQELGKEGRLLGLWARRGTRPRLIRQQQFEYAYIFGAVCPKKDRAVGLVLLTIGMGCMQKHLEEISKELSPAIMQLLYSIERFGIRRKSCIYQTIYHYYRCLQALPS